MRVVGNVRRGLQICYVSTNKCVTVGSSEVCIINTCKEISGMTFFSGKRTFQIKTWIYHCLIYTVRSNILGIIFFLNRKDGRKSFPPSMTYEEN
jgi:hypothetical protein